MFFFLLKSFTLLILSLNSSSDLVEPNDPHISNLLVSPDDCSKQHILCQFRLTRVQPCAQVRSVLESTRAIAIGFVRRKTKRLKAWTCEAYVKRENVFVHNPIINIVVMIVLIVICIHWNVHLV